MPTTVTKNNDAKDPKLVPVQTNYMSKYDFTNRYQPETLPDVVELYADGITGFLAMTGSERGISADQIYWGEQGRLRKAEKNVSLTAATNTFTCKDNTIMRVGTKIYVMDPTTGVKQTGLVTDVDKSDPKVFVAKPYDSASWNVGATGLNVAIIGSEFKKGSGPMEGTVVSEQSIYHTSLTISKDTHAMNDSDLCNVSWLYAPDGSPFWHHQEIEDFNRRFDDYEELNLILSTKIKEESDLSKSGYNSTMGLFDSIRARGANIPGIPQSLDEWGAVIKYLNKEGGEKSNCLWTNVDSSMAIDKIIANENYAKGGAGWGSFDNKEMAVKFGFDGFMFGGYEFYKKTWKLLDDPAGVSPENTGELGEIKGILMPMGGIRIQTGYNSSLSGALPPVIKYLTLLHKEGDGISRKRQTTFYGARVGNGREDVTGVDLLSERGLLLAGANRWGIFEG